MKSLAERMPHPSKCFNTTGNSWELDCSQKLEVNKKATWLLLTEASEHLHRQLQSRLRQNLHSLEPRLRHNRRIHAPKKEQHLPHMPAAGMAYGEKSDRCVIFFFFCFHRHWLGCEGQSCSTQYVSERGEIWTHIYFWSLGSWLLENVGYLSAWGFQTTSSSAIFFFFFVASTK